VFQKLPVQNEKKLVVTKNNVHFFKGLLFLSKHGQYEPFKHLPVGKIAG
jgi:hypothetical protein